jgi:adenylylsulfate kinase
MNKLKNITLQKFQINQTDREKLINQSSFCLWFTGLSGSGKTTIMDALENYLYQKKRHTYILDGDNLRHGLCSDLGFSINDRNENIRRAAETAKAIVDAGIIVLAGFITPLNSQRNCARNILKSSKFIEIYISTSLDECEKRDTKGLYKKARMGQIKNFTGIDSPFEIPINPNITIDTKDKSVSETVNQLIKYLNL